MGEVNKKSIIEHLFSYQGQIASEQVIQKLTKNNLPLIFDGPATVFAFAAVSTAVNYSSTIRS